MNSSYTLVNGDLRFHYLYWNLDGDGRPVLLLHGLASNARIWERVAPYLAEAGLRILAPDLRGHGLTDKPEDGYGFAAQSQDVRAFLEVCDFERPVIVGHSWGAMLALDYAARTPFGPHAPAGLVLVDGGLTRLHDYPGANKENTLERLAPPRLAGMPLESFLDRLHRPGQKWQPDEESISIILANFDVDDEDTISPHLSFDHHMQIVEAMWDLDTYERLAHLRCPVLAVPARPPLPFNPDEEALLRFKEQGVEKAHSTLPGMQIEWMPDSVHDIPLQKPVELASIINTFIESIP